MPGVGGASSTVMLVARRIRPPVAPMGWPSEMPEPLTFSRSRSSQPQPFSTASTCGAKASFSSTRSMSSQDRPVRSKSRFTAGTGPMPMRDGSQPAAAQLAGGVDLVEDVVSIR